MTDEVVPRLVRGVAGVGFGTTIQIILGFLAFLVGARWLPSDQFGAFVLFQVINLFLLMATDVLLQKTSVTQFLITEPETAKRAVVVTSLSYRLLFGAVIGVAMLGLMPWTDRLFHSPVLSRLAIFLPPFFLLSSLDELLFAILQGTHKYRQIALSQMITGVTRLCVVAILLVYAQMDVMGLLYAFLISLVVSVALQWWWVGQRPAFNLNAALYARLFRFGLPLGFNNVLTFFFLKLDRFLLAALVGAGGVASYEVAAKIPDNLQRLYQAFQSVFFPTMSELFAKGRRQAAEAVLNHSIRLLSFASICAALIVLLFRDGLTQLLFSNKYAGSAVAFALLMISRNMAISGNLMGTTLVAAGRSDRPIRISVAMAAVSLGSNLLLIPALGIEGAAWAAVIANYCTNLTASVWYLRQEGTRIWWSDLMKPVLLFALFAAYVLAAKPQSFALRTGLLCLFVLLALSFNLVSKRDLSLVSTILRQRNSAALPIPAEST